MEDKKIIDKLIDEAFPEKFTKAVDGAEYMLEPVNERTIKVIASKQVVDRDGDLVMIDGIDTKDFLRNPVVLWMHDHSECPVGKVTALYKEMIGGVPALIADIEFAETEDGMEMAYLYSNGFLSAVSISFQPDDAVMVRVDEKIRGWDIKTCKLIEISCVNVGANQDALVVGKAMRKSLEKIGTLEKTIETMKLEHDNAMLEVTAKLAKIAGTVKARDAESVAADPYAALFAVADSIEKRK